MDWNCDDCGACCIGMKVHARATGDYASGKDGYAVNDALRKRRLPLIDHDGYMPTQDEACVALDLETRGCTIYENRPWVCKAFQVGSQQCLSARVIMGIDTVPDPVAYLRRGNEDRFNTGGSRLPEGLLSAWIRWFEAQGWWRSAERVEGWMRQDALEREEKDEREMPLMAPMPSEEIEAEKLEQEPRGLRRLSLSKQKPFR